MFVRAFALVAALSAAAVVAQTPAATPAAAPSQWRMTAHAMGAAYETGTFDRPIDGGLRIVCTSDGAGQLVTQIKGVAPVAGSRFLLVTATRQGRSQTFAFTAGADGQVAFARARGDRQLTRLWTALRGGNNVTTRFADGSFAVQSLAGARTTLPARTCG